MKENNSISVIVPVDKLTAENEHYLTNLVNSFSTQEVPYTEIIFVGSKGDKQKLKKLVVNIKESNVVVLTDESDKQNVQSKFNLGLENTTSKYVTFMTPSIVLSQNINKIMSKYVERINTEENIGFLPIEVSYLEDGQFVGLVNQTMFSILSDEGLGCELTKDLALTFHQNLSLEGLVIKREVLSDLGGLKTNLPVGYLAEMLLRVTRFGGKITCVPKIGHQRISDAKTESNTVLFNMDSEEVLFWDETIITSAMSLEDEEVVFTAKVSED